MTKRDTGHVPSLSIIASPALREAVAEKLLTAIVGGELQSGDKLSEIQLGDRLGVSRTPLREALNHLVAEGLLVREPNRGVRVAPIDAVSAAHFYDCRILLETECIRISAPHVSSQETGRAQLLVDRMQQLHDHAPLTAAQNWEWLRIVEDFHDSYRLVCPNQELVDIIHGLSRRSLRLRALNVARAGRTAYSVSQHRRILRSLIARDGDQLVVLLTELLESSKTGVLMSLSETGMRPVGFQFPAEA